MTDRELEPTGLSHLPGSAKETSLTSPGDVDPLDRVAEEFTARCRRGEAPSIAEYEARLPDQADKIRKLLGAVATMEQLRRGSRPARFMPERIGEFRVLRELGRGGMGVVYEAVQESLWRHVAVKAIHPTQLDSKRLQRFQREAQAVAQLHHTNIVPIFGVGEHDGVPYYAMQYIRGRGLDALLDSWRRGRPPVKTDRWRIAARFMAQAAGALGYAHDQGVFHRDIKPANLLIDEHDSVWITDFGLAKLVGHEELTASGDVIGTLRYLAPESLRGISEGRSDVYSLGLTLYEMLTLSLPFGELSPSELLHQVGAGEPVRPRTLDPAIPRDLETIVLKATARELKDRYASAHALAADLECFLADRPIQARRANLVEHAWRWSRRNRATAGLMALAAGSLMVAAIAGWTAFVASNGALAIETNSRHQAETNVAMLNSFFIEMFDTLFPEDATATDREILPLTQPLLAETEGDGTARTFADRLNPPGPGGGPGGPGPGGPPDGSPPFDGGPPPPGGGPDFGGPPPGMGGPSDQTQGAERNNTLALVQSVLASYDRFVRSLSNRTNAQLQSEAAWVYYRMGTLNERIGDRVAADQAFDQALDIFDDLSTHESHVPGYFSKFFKVCSALNPWQADPTLQGAVEGRLKRLEVSLGRLLGAAPNNADYLRARMQLLAKLAIIRHRRHQPGVEDLLKQALALADDLIARNPEEGYPRSDRSDVLEAYAMVLEDQRRVAEARRLLDAAMDDLEWVAADYRRSESLASRMESLADCFERLGDQERSDQIQRRADEIDTRPTNSDRPKPGHPFGPRRADLDPSRDEGPTQQGHPGDADIRSHPL